MGVLYLKNVRFCSRLFENTLAMFSAEIFFWIACEVGGRE